MSSGPGLAESGQALASLEHVSEEPLPGSRRVAAVMLPKKAEVRLPLEASPRTVLQDDTSELWKVSHARSSTEPKHGQLLEQRVASAAAEEASSLPPEPLQALPGPLLVQAKPPQAHAPLSGEAMRQERRRREKEEAAKKRQGKEGKEGAKSRPVSEIEDESPTSGRGTPNKLFQGWWAKKSPRAPGKTSLPSPPPEILPLPKSAIPPGRSKAPSQEASQQGKVPQGGSGKIQAQSGGRDELAAPRTVIHARESRQDGAQAKASPKTPRAAAEEPHLKQAESAGYRRPPRLQVPDCSTVPPEDTPRTQGALSLSSRGTTPSPAPSPVAATPRTPPDIDGPSPSPPGNGLSAEGLVAKYIALEHKTAIEKARAKAEARAEAKWAGLILAKDQELHALRTRVLQLKDEVRLSPGAEHMERMGAHQMLAECQEELAQTRREAAEMRERVARAEQEGVLLAQQLQAAQAELASMASDVQQSNSALEAASQECAQLMQQVVHAEKAMQETQMERDVGWRAAKAGEAQVGKLTTTLAAVGQDRESSRQRLEAALAEKDAQIARVERERDELAQELQAMTEVLGKELVEAREKARDMEAELQQSCELHEAQCRSLEADVLALLRSVDAARDGGRERAERQVEVEEERHTVAHLRARLREVEDALSAKQLAADAVVARLLLQLEEGACAYAHKHGEARS